MMSPVVKYRLKPWNSDDSEPVGVEGVFGKSTSEQRVERRSYYLKTGNIILLFSVKPHKTDCFG